MVPTPPKVLTYHVKHALSVQLDTVYSRPLWDMFGVSVQAGVYP